MAIDAEAATKTAMAVAFAITFAAGLIAILFAEEEGFAPKDDPGADR